MGSPCLINACGNLDQDKNNLVCKECDARYLHARGKKYELSDIPTTHGTRQQEEESGMVKKRKRSTLCKAGDCERIAVSKGFCRPCYQKDRYWRLKRGAGIASPKPPIKTIPKNIPTRKPGPQPKHLERPLLTEETVAAAINELTKKHGISIEKLAFIVQAEALRRVKNA